ncbi:MAG: F0F1 ATP synthase subunit delta [Rhodothermales bacterium]
MSQTIARRYARALYELAEQKQCVDRVDEDVAMILESLHGSPELTRFLADPILNADKKGDVIKKLFATRLQDVTLSFLVLLVEKRREYLLSDVARSYHALRDEHMNVVRAEARVAIALSEAEEQTLARAIEKLTGQTVRLETRIDPSIIGGVVVRVGDTVYDRSVLNQLSRLKDQLEQRALSSN